MVIAILSGANDSGYGVGLRAQIEALADDVRACTWARSATPMPCL